jgi:hypothetical protein
METAYLIILSVGLLVRWVRSAGRFSNIEQRLDYLAQAQEIPDVAALTERIYNLEREVAELRSARVQLQPETARVMNVEPELQHQTPAPFVPSAPATPRHLRYLRRHSRGRPRRSNHLPISECHPSLRAQPSSGPAKSGRR